MDRSLKGISDVEELIVVLSPSADAGVPGARVKEGTARRAEVQVAYAIRVAQPVSVKVDTFGTGDARRAEAFVRKFDFRPRAIIERLDLLRPIYRRTTKYKHLGKAGLPWEV